MAPPLLTSVRNPKVAAATRLKKRAFRDGDRRFLLEGAQGLTEALETAGALEAVFTTDELHPIAVRARQLGIDTCVVSDDVMNRITSTVTPQGLVGISPFLDVALDDLPAGGCVVVLHQVRDPGNAGTVLRSADAAGASGVVFTTSSVDLYNPKTVRASAGSMFHLPVVRNAPTADTISYLRGSGTRVLAMDAEAEDDLYHVDLSGPIAFIFGNEAQGLPPEVRASADACLRVPHAGRAESLNLAAAATVCVFEWARQRGSSKEPLGSMIVAAAHDIRSPLTAMRGFGFALEHRWDEMSVEQRRMMLGGIVYDAERIDVTLRQLVDAARVVEGQLESLPEQTDVASLVREISATLARDPEHPAIAWAGEDVVAFVDPGRLRSALHAFIDSVVWWGLSGPVSIRARVELGRLHVTVSRVGTDLSSEGAQNLFMARRAGTGGGSKIGMYAARSVAEAVSGKAWGEVVDNRLMLHLELPEG